MKPLQEQIFFDQRDHELLDLVNEVRGRDSPSAHAKKRLYPFFHPRGIKEMAESRGLRIAYAAVCLIDSMNAGSSQERLMALRSLRSEVLSAASGPLPINTARVLLQIMKELVRSHGNRTRQLQLAHDFRVTAGGNPRVVRRQLRLYHLLEMPEEWNQLTFDDHVHDANTKGRKTAAHLIMDAWIKGIRRLRVIYYNHIEPQNAAELMEAAQIMGIILRIGIEFSARFRNRFIQLIWVPRGFPDTQAFLCFLAEEEVMALMAEGRKVSRYQQNHILDVLETFNRIHLPKINTRIGLSVPPLPAEDFLSFVGPGQASLLHLGRFIHDRLRPFMVRRVAALRSGWTEMTPEAQEKALSLIAAMDRLEAPEIVACHLKPELSPAVSDPTVVDQCHERPPLLAITPRDLLRRLSGLHSGYRITLNLTGLTAEDVLEILYDTEGMVTRLEIFNLKDHINGKTENIPDIHRLQQAINRGNAIALKRFIRDLIRRLERIPSPEVIGRTEKLRGILHDIAGFQSHYKGTPLKSRIGSDSTGSSPGFHGMGLAVVETLPPGARREIRRAVGVSRTLIPIHMTVYPRRTYIPRTVDGLRPGTFSRLMGRLPLPPGLGNRMRRDWVFLEDSTRMQASGNIVTLGGLRPETGNNLPFAADPPRKGHRRPSVKGRLNSRLKNTVKVLLGFLPAFLTFFLARDWWLLALFRSPDLVCHHRGPQHSSVGAGRGRLETVAFVDMERLRQLEPADRFAPFHRFFRSPAGLSGQIAPFGPGPGHQHRHGAGNALQPHGPGQRHLSVHPQPAPRAAPGGGHRQFLPQHSVDPRGGWNEPGGRSRHRMDRQKRCRNDPSKMGRHHLKSGIGPGGGIHRRRRRPDPKHSAPPKGLRRGAGKAF